MNAHSTNQENRRLFDRIEAEGIFVYEGEPHSIKDISVGGLQTSEKLPHAKKGTIVDGKVGLNHSSIRLYSDVICEVIDNTDAHGARLKFIDISEDFTEFLRSLALRQSAPTAHKASWIGNDSYQIAGSDDIQTDKSLITRLFRIETITGLAILAIALILLIRASSEQNFWVVAQHEILSPVSGEITWLHPDSIIAVGDEIASIAIETLTDQDIDFPIISRVGGLCCANWVKPRLPLSPDGFIPWTL